jgi:hypothetical protein
MGLLGAADWTAVGDQAGAGVGFSVGLAGDVNGDGYADVVVGAPWFDDGHQDEGRAYVYHGSASGLDAVPNWLAGGGQAGALLGRSAVTTGDVNGDGYADVIAGAPGEGRAVVYYGNRGAGLSLRPRQMRVGGSTPVAPSGIADPADAVQLELLGWMPLGRDKVKLQWQMAPLGVAFSDPGTIGGTTVDWVDTLTGGAALAQGVSGLTLGTPYRWRVRLLYRPGNRLGQSASRWVHIPWNGWAEQDFRTGLPEVAFASTAYEAPEGAGVAAITVTLSAAAGMTVTVDCVTSDGTAAEGEDYVSASDTLTFSPGQVEASLGVPIIDDDVDEADAETVLLTLERAVYATLGGTNPITLTIVDDDVNVVYLPLIASNYPRPIALLHVGDAIPKRPILDWGEVFYSVSVRVPDELPSGGAFVFSSRRDAVAEVWVDDELAILLDGDEVFAYDFSTSGIPRSDIVEVSRETMEGLIGQTITIEYRDMYGAFVDASPMWLLWVP